MSSPTGPSSDRGELEHDVRSLQRLTARIVKYDDRLDVKCWAQIGLGLKSVLGHILPGAEAGNNQQWTSSSAGQAALEAMQAIVEHAPAAMRAVTSSRQDQRGHSGILAAVCTVCHQFTEDSKHRATLPAVWPTGYQSSASVLANIAVLPQAALYEPDVMILILCASECLRSGHVDLPLKQRVDLILVQV